jgi:hypothetical protein
MSDQQTRRDALKTMLAVVIAPALSIPSGCREVVEKCYLGQPTNMVYGEMIPQLISIEAVPLPIVHRDLGLYVTGGGLMIPRDFLTHVVGIEEEKVTEILDNV